MLSPRGVPAELSTSPRSSRGERLPPNAAEIQAILADCGSIDLPDLASALRARGIPLTPERIAVILDRFPTEFAIGNGGQVTLAIGESAAGNSGEDPDLDPLWWESVELKPPLSPDKCLVLSVRTSDATRPVESISEIAIVDLSGRERFAWTASDEDALRAALVAVSGLIEGASAVIGFNARRFDLRCLKAVAARVGVMWSKPALVLDVHDLSLLVDPAIEDRTLTALCERFNAGSPTSQTAGEVAFATVSLLRALVATIDAADPNWALALRIIGAAGLGYERLVSAPVGPSTLAEALEARHDPLADSVAADRSGRPPRVAVAEAFEQYGQRVKGYRTRQGQLEMANAVTDTLGAGGQLVVEAPTGTGKSLGYLIPAAARAEATGQPVVIATHTKVLQRQLRSDAEALRDAGILNSPYRQIQGVANYLCPRNVADAITSRAEDTNWFAVAVAIRGLQAAANGVWDDLTDGLPTRSDLSYRRERYRLRATAGTCDRWDCDFVDQCPLYQRLRGVSTEPGVIAANHALVGAWTRAAADGSHPPGEVFADRPTALVIDEAHNLEGTLTDAWADRVSGPALAVAVGMVYGRHGIARTARDIARHDPALEEPASDLGRIAGDVNSAVDALGDSVAEYLHDFGGASQVAELRPAVVRSRPLYQQVQRAAARASGLLRTLMARLISVRDAAGERRPAFRRRVAGMIEDLQKHADVLTLLRELPAAHAYLYQLSAPASEAGGEPREEWEFARLPIDVAPLYREYLASTASAIVLTSATLRVDGSFEYLGSRLGLAIETDAPTSGVDSEQTLPATGLVVDSPFDHEQQSAVVLTSHLPLPTPATQDEFCEELAADHIGFLSISGGRSLGLFAARARMERVAMEVRDHASELAARGVELLVQGEDSPSRIQARFRESEGTCVYGLRSYWEGFDAPGETLSYLLIEKPPYPHPDDLLIRARQRALLDRGDDPFLGYVVPLTAIALTQGFGRLIRREDDRGVAIISDRRMQVPSAANGILLNSLPTPTRHYAVDREDAWSFAIHFVTGEDPDLTQALLVQTDRVAELLQELRLKPGEDPEAKLRQAARELFEIEHLRIEQLEIMIALLSGRDVLGFLPTGSGKSLTYQLPALIHPNCLPTIVVSPLVALIKDQVDEVRGRRRIRAVAGITGRTSSAERTETMRDLAEGRIRLLYVSPERLVRDPILRQSIARQPLGALVVDEAHCVSSWGHDFRPEFRQITSAVKTFRRSPRLALTATATRDVEADIVETLEFEDPVLIRRPVDRPDLAYWVQRFGSDADRTRELIRLATYMGDSPGIVYASRRALTEELAWILREAGFSARPYHAGLVPEQREAIQDDFLAGTTRIIVATKAFGMGVNKPDVGWVVHYDLPESLEGYAQEAGRAARAPGLTGLCVLFYATGDIARRRGHLRRSTDRAAEARAVALLDLLHQCPTRGGDFLIDPVAAGEKLQLEADDLNIAIAWLERAGAIERLHDCSTRAKVSVGYREPTDAAERRLFVNIVKHQLSCRVGEARLIDIAVEAQAASLDPDEFEGLLIDWSLRRLVTFHTTQRQWRIRRVGPLDPKRLNSVLEAWQRLEKRRLEEIIDYATGRTCRRSAILRAFGDAQVSCEDAANSIEKCDVHARSGPPWHAVAPDLVIDPESLVDVGVVLLQAVRWANRFSGGKYGEVGLKAALCGKESLGPGRPLGRGLMSCPQFGALRYIRRNEKRLDEEVAALISRGAIARQEVVAEGRTYQSLVLTDAGIAFLDGVV